MKLLLPSRKNYQPFRTMKIYRIIVVCWLIVSTAVAVKAQTTTYNESNPVAPPVLLLRGSVVQIGCDSVWLMSPYRLGLYEEARQLVMSLNTTNVETLISNYEHKLSLYSYWNDSLRRSYRILSRRYDSTLARTSSELFLMSSKLDHANEAILESRNHLDDAIESVKKSRTEKWLWGLGGILAGLGIASLL